MYTSLNAHINIHTRTVHVRPAQLHTHTHLHAFENTHQKPGSVIPLKTGVGMTPDLFCLPNLQNTFQYYKGKLTHTHIDSHTL